MVIARGNEFEELSSNPGRYWSWELIFIYCGLFVLILVVFFFFFFFFVCCFFFHYVSAKFHLWPSSGDLPRPRMGMLSLVTVSPVITAFHSCCLSHHVFDQVNLWPAWVGFETAIFWQCSPGTVTDRVSHRANALWKDKIPSVLLLIWVNRRVDWVLYSYYDNLSNTNNFYTLVGFLILIIHMQLFGFKLEFLFFNNHLFKNSYIVSSNYYYYYYLAKNYSFKWLFLIQFLHMVMWYQVFLSNTNNFQIGLFDLQLEF